MVRPAEWIALGILCGMVLGMLIIGVAFSFVPAEAYCDCRVKENLAYAEGLDDCDELWQNQSGFDFDLCPACIVYAPINYSVVNTTFWNETFWNESAKEWSEI